MRQNKPRRQMQIRDIENIKKNKRVHMLRRTAAAILGYCPKTKPS